MEVTSLEAAFERITVADENDTPVSSTTTYSQSKVRNVHRDAMYLAMKPDSNLPRRHDW